jgi:anthraniloyl-CoA monooxygenase
MKIRILGGGPGGLYTAILSKRIHPDWDVELHERNGAHDTFGWGVVFSDETLGNFAEADAHSYAQIAERFVRWTDIDTFAKGEHIRSTGHGFCGIARVSLLEILHERARSLGVRLHFGHEASHTDFPDADLIVAADGINSRTRTELAHAFEPSIEPGQAPFIWLGTDRVFDAFTFIFRANEHGTFQVHAYPFSRERSTFIVETDDATCARAGLERMSVEESVAYLERLFAPDLAGARLLTNKSSFIRFRRVKNRRWHAGNVVLIGDAAHTAHFSIGSGTKLAMEDAIALVNALGSEASVEQALARYTDVRWVEAAKLQKSASVSQQWFERAALMHHKLSPLELVASMMTRSKRVTHENLRLRDPALVKRIDESVAHKSGLRRQGEGPVPPPMFTPFKLRELTLANRVVVSPMCQYSAHEGTVDDHHLVHLGARAMGGAGLVIAEMTNVSADARITHGCAGIYSDAHVAAWQRIVRFVHARTPAKIGIQLGHAGRKGSTKLPWEGKPDEPLAQGGWEILAPSAIPYREGSQVPRAMTRTDMERVREAYVQATQRAEAAGFDLLELHMAHGYLLSSFISQLSNQRTDDYGGTLHGRMRFPLEVLVAVRAAWPAHKPLSVRISAVDWVEGGLTIDDAIELSRMLKQHGADLIDVSSGQTTPLARPEYGRMYQTPFANLIRHAAEIPTMAVGAIQNWDQVNTIIASGRADLCALARPHLADAAFTLHAAAEQRWDVPWPVQYTPAKPRF